MKRPLLLIACLVANLALAGCTDADWNRMANYGGLGDDAGSSDAAETEVAAETRGAAPRTQAVAAPQPVAAMPAPANNDFCKSVATQDATSNGFDPATQQRVLAQSYQQCLTIYNR